MAPDDCAPRCPSEGGIITRRVQAFTCLAASGVSRSSTRHLRLVVFLKQMQRVVAPSLTEGKLVARRSPEPRLMELELPAILLTASRTKV